MSLPYQWPEARSGVGGVAVGIAEDECRALTGGLLLCLERVEDDLRHLDVALREIRLGVGFLAVHDGLPDEDQAALEVDVLPLEAMYLARAHAGEEAHREVVAKVGARGVEDFLHFPEGEWVNIGSLDPELFDVLEGRAKIVAVGGFAEDLP